MLRSGGPLCDISFWRTGVGQLWLFGQVLRCSTGNVVLNFVPMYGCTAEHRLRAIVLFRCPFSSEVFSKSPLHFRSASFFTGGLLIRAPCVLGLSLFYRRSFWWSPLHVRDASLFIGGLFISPLRFWVPLLSSKVFLISPLRFWVPLFSSDD
jgi:hypothetical protein